MRAMLKHKIRKSRKNILSLLESDADKDRKEIISEYSEVRKKGKKEKKKHERNGEYEHLSYV